MINNNSKFYERKLYSELSHKDNTEKYVENLIEPGFINKVFCKSSDTMPELPDNSVHLAVTSPPYNVGKEYDEDLSLGEYRKLLKQTFKELYRVLVTGGRACINIANLGRKPYLPIHDFIIEDMQSVGFLMRGEIIWDKGDNATSSTAWGSYLKASNPVLRDIHEYILVFCKNSFTRHNLHNRKSTISRKEFLEYTKSIWRFPPEHASKIGHPAPFPVELPYRLIQLYTFEDEIVLDPFAGSGSTCIAALKTNRRFVAYDINEKYCDLATERISKFLGCEISSKKEKESWG